MEALEKFPLRGVSIPCKSAMRAKISHARCEEVKVPRGQGRKRSRSEGGASGKEEFKSLNEDLKNI